VKGLFAFDVVSMGEMSNFEAEDLNEIFEFLEIGKMDVALF
jgi:hypothetical protein